jgi:putative transposase
VIAAQAHYVVLIAVAGEVLFRAKADFQRMLEVLQMESSIHKVGLNGYALLPTQVHLLVTPVDQSGLARMMQGVGRSYVRHVNQRYDRAGTLWSGRYKSCVIQPGEWLYKTLVFLDHLPVLRACVDFGGEVVHCPADYEWTSHLHYTGRRRDAFITAPQAIWNLGNTPFAREESYATLVTQGVGVQDIQQLQSAVSGGWVLGEQAYVAQIQEKVHRRVAKSKPGRPCK